MPSSVLVRFCGIAIRYLPIDPILYLEFLTASQTIPRQTLSARKYFAGMDAVFQLLHLYLKSTILQTQNIPIFQAIRTQ